MTVEPGGNVGDNRAPGAIEDAYRVKEDRILKRGAAIGVLVNDTDPDGDALAAEVVVDPGKGTLTLDPDGSFVYKSKRNFHGTDCFTYAASDGRGGTVTATVPIKVLARPG